MSSNIAILHDQFRMMGGAERVGCELARALDAPIYAGRVDDGVPPGDVDVRELFDGVTGRAMRRHWLIQDFGQMFAWQHRPELWDYDVVLINKTNPLWYQPRDHQVVLGYLHSTPRALYDQFDKQGGGVLTALTTAMRTLYETNRTRPDAWVCNSDLVQRRAALYWDRRRDTSVIYPPVETARLSPNTAETADYYVTVGRLSDNKRVPDIVRAFQNTDKRLVVAGDGKDMPAVKRLAAGHENIMIRGHVPEDEKRRLLSEAKAFVMNAECEDFGISPIEAMAAGTPVLGVAEGFTKHQITDGENGLLYERGQLAGAIGRFERDGVSLDERGLAASVSQFSTARFRAEVQAWVEHESERHRVDVDLTEGDAAAEHAEVENAGR